MASCVEGACSRESCILCFNVLAKGTDRNLVNGKNKISFVVHNLSKYICKKCLTLAKKQSGLKDKLKDIDCRLTALYREKWGQISMSMKRKHSSAEDVDVQPSEDYASR